jgi:hypothetical protein
MIAYNHLYTIALALWLSKYASAHGLAARKEVESCQHSCLVGHWPLALTYCMMVDLWWRNEIRMTTVHWLFSRLVNRADSRSSKMHDWVSSYQVASVLHL